MEGEIVGEVLDVHGSVVPGAASFIREAVGELQTLVIQVGAAVEGHRACRGAETVREGDPGSRADGIRGAGLRAGAETRGSGNGVKCFGLSDGDSGGSGEWSRRGGGGGVDGVVDRWSLGSVGNGHGLCGSVGARHRGKRWHESLCLQRVSLAGGGALQIAWSAGDGGDRFRSADGDRTCVRSGAGRGGARGRIENG